MTEYIERSMPEKQILKQILKESKRLPYPLIEHHDDRYFTEWWYDIPTEELAEVVKKLYPFEEMPALDTLLFDIHEEEFTTLSKCKVIRWEKRNILVSEFYWRTGGTVLDLICKDGGLNEVKLTR